MYSRHIHSPPIIFILSPPCPLNPSCPSTSCSHFHCWCCWGLCDPLGLLKVICMSMGGEDGHFPVVTPLKKVTLFLQHHQPQWLLREALFLKHLPDRMWASYGIKFSPWCNFVNLKSGVVNRKIISRPQVMRGILFGLRVKFRKLFGWSQWLGLLMTRSLEGATITAFRLNPPMPPSLLSSPLPPPPSPLPYSTLFLPSEFHTVYPRLAGNSLCSLDWPQTHCNPSTSACLVLDL